MKTIYKSIGVLLLCGALCMPALDAQTTRGRNNGGGTRTTQPASRPSSAPQQRPGQNTRPGNSGQRPGNSGNNRPQQQPQRPGNSGQRPGQNNRPSQPQQPQRPGNGNHGGNNNRPGVGNRPPQQPNHGKPQPGPGLSHGMPPGHGPAHSRPYMPPPRPFARPLPPPSWRPAPSWRPFRSILGITLGTAFNLSVSALINSGYTVSNYANNQIFLTDVPMLNLIWPDAVMYYNNSGSLYGSRFIYSTSYPDQSRFQTAYASLVAGYGAPYDMQSTGNGFVASWWGTGNQFIRLTYEPEYSSNGYLRYFTTLSFGN